MVRIVIKHLKSDDTIKGEEDEARAEAEKKVGDKEKTHGQYDPNVVTRVADLDPNEKLMAGGAPTTLTPEIIGKVIGILPDKMSPAGFVLLAVNIMACFNMMQKAPQVLIAMMAAIKELKDKSPELFEDGGYRRLGEILEEQAKKKKN